MKTITHKEVPNYFSQVIIDQIRNQIEEMITDAYQKNGEKYNNGIVHSELPLLDGTISTAQIEFIGMVENGLLKSAIKEIVLFDSTSDEDINNVLEKRIKLQNLGKEWDKS